ncbi:hypothetical protein FHS96_000536 [Sphingomonas zeicaulis]|uniref:hypothetical protein n=1 Tax=Sphingomonas zeicaulis TaxID=1632740 RepID=UPI003D1DA028
MNLLCRIVGHDANRQRARHDMEDYWAPCRRCGTMLVRATAGWRAPTIDEIETHNRNLAHMAQRPHGMRVD